MKIERHIELGKGRVYRLTLESIDKSGFGHSLLSDNVSTIATTMNSVQEKVKQALKVLEYIADGDV